MKKILVFSAMVLTSSAFAQSAPGSGLPPAAMRDKMAVRMAEFLFKDCDANKDGKFDQKEGVAAKEAVMKKYDANKDGKLDDAEFTKLRDDAKAAGWKPRGPGSAPVKTGPAPDAPVAPAK